MDEKKQIFSIASIVKGVASLSISQESSDWIQFSPLAYRSIFENEYCTGMTSLHELPPAGIYCIRNLSSAPTHGIVIDLIPFSSFSSPSSLLDQPQQAMGLSAERIEFERQLAADQLLSELKASVWRRISTIDSIESCPHICVMFSGGIDCSLLACLICLLLKEHALKWTVELVSIAFGENIEEKEQTTPQLLVDQIPDRYTGCM